MRTMIILAVLLAGCSPAVSQPPKMDAIAKVAEMRKAEALCSPAVSYAHDPHCQRYHFLVMELEEEYGLCLMEDRLYARCDPNQPLVDGDGNFR